MALDKVTSKKRAADFSEILDATGQEDDKKAVKWVKEVEEQEQKDAKKRDADEMEALLDKQRGTKNPYYEALYNLAKRRLAAYDIPKNYRIDVLLKPEGKIIFGLQRVGFRWYAKGMTICGEPKYDINCVDRLAIQTMVAIDELESQHEKHKTKSGIHLPAKSKLSL